MSKSFDEMRKKFEALSAKQDDNQRTKKTSTERPKSFAPGYYSKPLSNTAVEVEADKVTQDKTAVEKAIQTMQFSADAGLAHQGTGSVTRRLEEIRLQYGTTSTSRFQTSSDPDLELAKFLESLDDDEFELNCRHFG